MALMEFECTCRWFWKPSRVSGAWKFKPILPCSTLSLIVLPIHLIAEKWGGGVQWFNIIWIILYDCIKRAKWVADPHESAGFDGVNVNTLEWEFLPKMTTLRGEIESTGAQQSTENLQSERFGWFYWYYSTEMTQLMGRILYDLGMVLKTLQTIRYIRYIYLTVFGGSSTTAVWQIVAS